MPNYRPSPYPLIIIKSQSGLGLKTTINIPKRRFIIEYTGDLITENEANKKGGKYLFDIGNGMAINGGHRSNLARYINHSCKPNCEVETKGNHVYIFSKKVIKANEELTYDYGQEYFKHFIKPHGCRCQKCKINL